MTSGDTAATDRESPDDNVVVLDGVRKDFGSYVAVERADFAIGSGGFFSLLGPSGCGKTTLLKMIAGFEQPTAGRVILEGTDVSGVPPHKRNVNTVFQQYALFPHMSVVDNVAFGLRAKKIPGREARRRAKEMLDVIARYRMRGGALINLLLVLPLTTPEIVMGASLFTLFLNQGVTPGFWTIVLAHTMFCLSFVALTVKARIRGLDWTLEDAAADLGSPPLRTFVKITLPLIVPGIAAAFLLSLSLSIDDYIITSLIAGRVSTLPREIFDSSKVEIPPQVHVLATLIMLVAIAILVAGTLLGNRRRSRT